MFAVRKLTAADAEAMRELRLQSLAYYGDIFKSFREQEAAKPFSYWQDQCTEQLTPPYRCWFGSFEGDKLVGLQGTRLWEESPDTPVGFWWGNYSHDDYRGRGAMKPLYEARIKWAKDHGCESIVGYILEGKQRPLEIFFRLGGQFMFTRNMRHGDGPEVPWHWYKIPLVQQKLDAA